MIKLLASFLLLLACTAPTIVAAQDVQTTATYAVSIEHGKEFVSSVALFSIPVATGFEFFIKDGKKITERSKIISPFTKEVMNNKQLPTFATWGYTALLRYKKTDNMSVEKMLQNIEVLASMIQKKFIMQAPFIRTSVVVYTYKDISEL